MSFSAFLKRKRVFRSQVFVPFIEQLYVLMSYVLPSAHIRYRVYKRYTGSLDTSKPQGAQDLDPRDKEMGRRLEWYMLGATALLFAFVWTQSHACAWHSWGWSLRVSVGLLVVIRIGEIVSLATSEVVFRRIDVDAATGLATLVIYGFQAVAIFAICSEYALYASGYQRVFRSDEANFPSHWWDYAYVAGSNLTTFGTAYPPLTFWARLTVLCSSLIFVVLFSVLLTFVVAQIRPDSQGEAPS